MIVLNPQPDRINATVLGEFTIADYREFEAAALAALDGTHRPDLLFDLAEMTGYTLDVAWEEIRFSRQHARDFDRIAVVTTNQWTIWSAWLSQLFTDADVEVFDDLASATRWLDGTED